MKTDFTVTLHVFDPNDGEWRVTEEVPFRSAYRIGKSRGFRHRYNRVTREIRFREKERNERGEGWVVVLTW